MRRQGIAVTQHAQDGEQVRHALDFINHNQAAQVAQGGHGFLQTRQAG